MSATWTPNVTNATNATYTIYDGSQASGSVLGTVTVNQTKHPVGTLDDSSRFHELGVFYPTSGTLTVVLNANTANGSVVADAIGVAPAWASSGGPSQFEPEPSYQLPFQNTGYRTTPDVSFDASENSGVTCYENGAISYNNCGTSLACPCWAGLIAIANQGLVAEGGTTLNSTTNPQQTLQVLYGLPQNDFHDITAGYNGFEAGLGYDFVTGRGTPIANLLIPDLVSSVPLSLSESGVSVSATSLPTGNAATVTLTAKDAAGNQEESGGLNVVFGVGTGSTGSGTFSAVTDNGNGTYSATFTATIAGSLSITATVDGRPVTSTAPTLTVTVLAPSVTGINPNSGPAAGGTTVTIIGTGFTGATAVDFGVAASSFTINSATRITATSPPGTGTVDVTVVTAGGTSTTLSADQFTFVGLPSVAGISPTSGPTTGGTSVTINGANLAGATAVDFGAAAASSFTVNSATQITATSPPGTGTVDVTVVTAGGTSTTSSADQFTFVGLPSVGGISPASGPTTGGTSVTISGANLAGATAVDFGAAAASSFTVNSATQITATSPPGTGTVDVTVVTAGGTSTTSSADQFTYLHLYPSKGTIVASKRSITSSQLVKITVTVKPVGTKHGTPTGTVTFYDNGNLLGTANSATLNKTGQASLTAQGSALSPGMNKITWSYGGDSTYIPEMGTTSVTVKMTVKKTAIKPPKTAAASKTVSQPALSLTTMLSAPFKSSTKDNEHDAALLALLDE